MNKFSGTLEEDTYKGSMDDEESTPIAKSSSTSNKLTGYSDTELYTIKNIKNHSYSLSCAGIHLEFRAQGSHRVSGRILNHPDFSVHKQYFSISK